MSKAKKAAGAISYAAVCREAAGTVERFCEDSGDDQRYCETHAPRAAALRELAALVEKISEAVAVDERARTLVDPSARSSEQQYAEEEIISAAVSIAAGFQPSPPGGARE